jgi:60S ribosomal subunit assembly/export protein LOC1
MSLAKPGGAQKTKSTSDKALANKKKRRVYTEKELDIPKLNGIIPAGVQKPKGVKKGKKFVDDPASMMAIMAVVNAEKEGHIESKIMRARQLEEVREARKKEIEARSDEKKAKFEDTKDSLRKKRKHKNHGAKVDHKPEKEAPDNVKPKKKRVSFG